MTSYPIDQFVVLILLIVAVYGFIEFHKELAAFYVSCRKHIRCKTGFHNAGKSKYYCSDCKLPSKSHLKVHHGEGRYKKKIDDFKF